MTLATRDDVQNQDNEDHQQALATRRVELSRPIGDTGALKGLLEAQKKGIAQSLPRHITPERLIKTMLVATNRNPAILRCTQGSILETIMRAAELGLDLSGTLGEAYPVPYGDQLTLIIGYRGLEKLAWQTGEVESIDAEVVCQHDTFKFRKGTEVTVEWSPKLDGDRGPAIGAYACVKLKNGGKLARFLAKSDIEKIRNSSKSGNSPAWKNWWDEMARKCALKRTLKDAPLSTEKFVRAMEQDSEDYDLADNVVEAETRPRGSQALVDKLKAREQLTDTQLSEEEANQIIEQRAAAVARTAQSPSAPGPAEVSREPVVAGAEEQPLTTTVKGVAFPARLPDEWRTDLRKLDDAIRAGKPESMQMPPARACVKKLMGVHSWEALDFEAQDSIYASILNGEAFGD